MSKNQENIPQENEEQAKEQIIEDLDQDCIEVIEEDSLSSEIDRLTAELEKEKNDYLYLRADFDNYRKRTLREREELIRNAAESTMLGLLPIIDDFERGLQAAKSADNAEAVYQGMELIYNKLMNYLSQKGVKPIDSTGQPFDLDLHEAIAMIPAPSEDLKGIVLDTVQRGYMINDKVLRHAKVAVGE